MSFEVSPDPIVLNAPVPDAPVLDASTAQSKQTLLMGQPNQNFDQNFDQNSDRLLNTIPQSLLFLGLGILLIVLLRVIAPVLPPLLSPELIQDQDILRDFIGTLAQVLSGVLGFTISVVAIVVQLSASRFTPKVTELFLREKVNFLIISFLITANLVSIWTSLVFSVSEKPIALILLNLVLGTLSFVVLIPYFIFVFNFLQPAAIIRRLEYQVRQTIMQADKNRVSMALLQRQCLSTLDEFKSIATSSLQQRDTPIILESLDSLKNTALFYGTYKNKVVADWFCLTPSIQRDPDFVSLEAVTLQEIETAKHWLEVKIFRQYHSIFSDSLNYFREVCYIVAINTRQIAEQALQHNDQETAYLAIKFFNTYLRTIITTPDVRAGYTIVKEYRLLAEAALRYQHETVVLDIAYYFRYYSFLAYKADLVFLPETFAADLGLLAQRCCEQNSEISAKVLEIFLKIDQDSESEHQENTLRGVRKSQVKLAAYYLKSGHRPLAQVIFNDMQHEPSTRLQLIFSELRSAQADFWEFRDRGGEDFYYINLELAPFLSEFCNWFNLSC
jgi:hypothetical protein